MTNPDGKIQVIGAVSRGEAPNCASVTTKPFASPTSWPLTKIGRLATHYRGDCG